MFIYQYIIIYIKFKKDLYDTLILLLSYCFENKMTPKNTNILKVNPETFRDKLQLYLIYNMYFDINIGIKEISTL